jgi:hypothetical protein
VVSAHFFYKKIRREDIVKGLLNYKNVEENTLKEDGRKTGNR